MTETTSLSLAERTDEDILEDIHRLVRSYKPLILSRGYFQYHVVHGVVMVEGHIKSALARQIFTDSLPDIEGVVAVDASKLYDDETLRYSLGKLLPDGVRVRTDHGVVVLTGHLPADMPVNALIGLVGEVHGVREVKADFA